MNEKERKERMLELLADQAIFGLSAQEKTEFDSLSVEFPDLAEDFSLEEAAAAIAFSGVEDLEVMPAGLHSSIMKDAEKYFAAASDPIISGVETNEPREEARSERVVFETPARPFWQSLGWAFAAVACAALIANVWFTRVQPIEMVKNPPVTGTPAPKLSLAQKRDQFLASAKDLFKAPVSSPTEDKDLSGEIVWSDTEQTGYMTFKGLPVNDKTKEAYQLWIFDETQDEKTPVDGGVFNVDKNGEVIIPIDAKLLVKKPKMFAVTVEKPGGVVVSKREKIVALGKVEA
ncbi:MAG: anti-sigma factor [Acidobacteria bacterium]|nr:anti-sigma factor [Acidobacteriota bacterium]